MIDLSVIIPIYNKETVLAEKLAEIYYYFKNHNLNTEIIIVDDGSMDRTGRYLQHILERFEVRCVHHLNNCGRGAAIRTGVRNSKGQNILVIDFDMAVSISQFEKFKPWMNKVDLLVGKREENLENNFLIKKFLNLSDVDTKCKFKMFSCDLKPIIEKTKMNNHLFDEELLYLAKKNNNKIQELCIDRGDRSQCEKNCFRTVLSVVKIKLNEITGKY